MARLRWGRSNQKHLHGNTYPQQLMEKLMTTDYPKSVVSYCWAGCGRGLSRGDWLFNGETSPLNYISQTTYRVTHDYRLPEICSELVVLAKCFFFSVYGKLPLPHMEKMNP